MIQGRMKMTLPPMATKIEIRFVGGVDLSEADQAAFRGNIQEYIATQELKAHIGLLTSEQHPAYEARGSYGLFANRRIEKLGVIGEYQGILVNGVGGEEYKEAEEMKWEDDAYIFQLAEATEENDEKVIDGGRFRNELALINDFRNFKQNEADREVNVSASWVQVKMHAAVDWSDHIFVWAKRRVDCGRELLLDYGGPYGEKLKQLVEQKQKAAAAKLAAVAKFKACATEIGAAPARRPSMGTKAHPPPPPPVAPPPPIHQQQDEWDQDECQTPKEDIEQQQVDDPGQSNKGEGKLWTVEGVKCIRIPEGERPARGFSPFQLDVKLAAPRLPQMVAMREARYQHDKRPRSEHRSPPTPIVVFGLVDFKSSQDMLQYIARPTVTNTAGLLQTTMRSFSHQFQIRSEWLSDEQRTPELEVYVKMNSEVGGEAMHETSKFRLRVSTDSAGEPRCQIMYHDPGSDLWQEEEDVKAPILAPRRRNRMKLHKKTLAVPMTQVSGVEHQRTEAAAVATKRPRTEAAAASIAQEVRQACPPKRPGKIERIEADSFRRRKYYAYDNDTIAGIAGRVGVDVDELKEMNIHNIPNIHSKLKECTWVYLPEDDSSSDDQDSKCNMHECLRRSSGPIAARMPHPFFAEWMGVQICEECRLYLVRLAYIGDEEDVHDRFCTMCGNFGDHNDVRSVTQCDGCPFVYCEECLRQHPDIFGPMDVDSDPWFCFQCEELLQNSSATAPCTGMGSSDGGLQYLQWTPRRDQFGKREYRQMHFAAFVDRLEIQQGRWAPLRVGQQLDFCYSNIVETWCAYWCRVTITVIQEDSAIIEYRDGSKEKESIGLVKLLSVHCHAPPGTYALESESDEDSEAIEEDEEHPPPDASLAGRRPPTNPSKRAKRSKAPPRESKAAGVRRRRSTAAAAPTGKTFHNCNLVVFSSSTSLTEPEEEECEEPQTEDFARNFVLEASNQLRQSQPGSSESRASTRHAFEQLCTVYARQSAGFVWTTESVTAPDLIGNTWEQRADALQKLQQTFKLASFRPLQLEAITALVHLQKNAYVHMPTGSGKSMIFILATIMMPAEKITIIISPLVALSYDIKTSLRKSGLEALQLRADANMEDKSQLERIVDGTQACRFLIITPEKLAKSGALRDALKQLDEKGRLGLIAVDEAHCIADSQPDFRPEYATLGRCIREVCVSPQICALSAVGGNSVVETVTDCLFMHRHDTMFFRGKFLSNSAFRVQQRKSDIDTDLLIAEIQKSDHVGSSMIVYCRTIRQIDYVVFALSAVNISCEGYHSKVTDRENIQGRWMRDELQVVVATNSFGLGIDKADVRKIIHYGFPKSMQQYYQEAGRGGRDGNGAVCIILWHPNDYQGLRKLLSYPHPKRPTPQEINSINEIGRFLFSTECRQVAILNASGAPIGRRDPSFQSCRCDNCQCDASSPDSSCSLDTPDRLDVNILEDVHDNIRKRSGVSKEQLKGLIAKALGTGRSCPLCEQLVVAMQCHGVIERHKGQFNVTTNTFPSDIKFGIQWESEVGRSQHERNYAGAPQRLQQPDQSDVHEEPPEEPREPKKRPRCQFEEQPGAAYEDISAAYEDGHNIVIGNRDMLGNKSYKALPFKCRYLLELAVSTKNMSWPLSESDAQRLQQCTHQSAQTHQSEHSFIATLKSMMSRTAAGRVIPDLKSRRCRVNQIECWQFRARAVFHGHEPSITVEKPTIEQHKRFFSRYGSDRFLFVSLSARAPPDMAEKLASMYIVLCGWRYKLLGFDGLDVIYFAESSYYQTDQLKYTSVHDVRLWHIPDTVPNRRDMSLAKYNARFHLGFSSTRRATQIVHTDIVRETDVVSNNRAVLNDGCARIGARVVHRAAGLEGPGVSMETICTSLGEPFSSGAQFRVWSIKGLMVVDSAVTDGRIYVPDSMFKWDGPPSSPEQLFIEVNALVQPPKRASLNRQFISALQGAGVPASVFMEMLDESLADFRLAMTDSREFSRLTDFQEDGSGGGMFEQRIRACVKAGFDFSSPVVKPLLVKLAKAKLLTGKDAESRLIRLEMSCHCLITYDYTGTLEPGTCFLASTCAQNLVGKHVAVLKNPCMHPKEVRKWRVVDAPAEALRRVLEARRAGSAGSDLFKLPDVLVLPAHRSLRRSPADEMAGADYDGAYSGAPPVLPRFSPPIPDYFRLCALCIRILR
jgi:RecQ family ATP-dependent DNA helicase